MRTLPAAIMPTERRNLPPPSSCPIQSLLSLLCVLLVCVFRVFCYFIVGCVFRRCRRDEGFTVNSTFRSCSPHQRWCARVDIVCSVSKKKNKNEIIIYYYYSPNTKKKAVASKKVSTFTYLHAWIHATHWATQTADAQTNEQIEQDGPALST